MNDKIAIIEIGSTNTKINICENGTIIEQNNYTIEFKTNYYKEEKIDNNDLNKLYNIIENIRNITKKIHLYGCSIFRNISKVELDNINEILIEKYNIKIEVITQEDEAKLTALGCYSDIQYDKNICIFIGGGGSTELVFVKNKKIISEKHFDFGVVDITRKFTTLKNDIPECTFEEVYEYIDKLIGNIDIQCETLILAGGDHLYWYNNAGYELLNNHIYESENQKYMITNEMSDNYDKNTLITSLDAIRNNSDNPLWFDGSRAMKVINNVVLHKVNAKYIIPTKINMEQGLINNVLNKQ